jgi:hypothetical protein
MTFLYYLLLTILTILSKIKLIKKINVIITYSDFGVTFIFFFISSDLFNV